MPLRLLNKHFILDSVFGGGVFRGNEQEGYELDLCCSTIAYSENSLWETGFIFILTIIIHGVFAS